MWWTGVALACSWYGDYTCDPPGVITTYPVFPGEALPVDLDRGDGSSYDTPCPVPDFTLFDANGDRWPVDVVSQGGDFLVIPADAAVGPATLETSEAGPSWPLVLADRPPVPGRTEIAAVALSDLAAGEVNLLWSCASGLGGITATAEVTLASSRAGDWLRVRVDHITGRQLDHLVRLDGAPFAADFALITDDEAPNPTCALVEVFGPDLAPIATRRACATPAPPLAPAPRTAPASGCQSAPTDRAPGLLGWALLAARRRRHRPD
jgi:hypothetical protein